MGRSGSLCRPEYRPGSCQPFHRSAPPAATGDRRRAQAYWYGRTTPSNCTGLPRPEAKARRPALARPHPRPLKALPRQRLQTTIFSSPPSSAGLVAAPHSSAPDLSQELHIIMSTVPLDRKCTPNPLMSISARFRGKPARYGYFSGEKSAIGAKMVPKRPDTTVPYSQHYRFFPSNGVSVRIDRSTPSRQRMLTATISLPLGASPRENEPTPHWPQNKW